MPCETSRGRWDFLRRFTRTSTRCASAPDARVRVGICKEAKSKTPRLPHTNLRYFDTPCPRKSTTGSMSLRERSPQNDQHQRT